MNGRVLDGSTGLPVDAVAVAATDTASGLTRGDVTGADGRFDFDTPIPARLAFRRLGYEPIDADAYSQDQGDVRMWPSTEVLPEFEVVARRSRGVAYALLGLLLAAAAVVHSQPKRGKGQR